MIGYVYKYTMLPTNKIYVGQHQTTNDYLDENYWGSGVSWKRDLDIYGKQNVKREIIEWCDTFNDLNNSELYWIDKLNARNPEIGYNIKIGGQDNLKGENNPHYGVHTNYGGGKRTPWTKEQRKHLSECNFWKKIGTSNRAGCKITEEQKSALKQGFDKIDNWSEINKKVREKRKINGTCSTKKRKVKNITKNELYYSVNSAEKIYGKLNRKYMKTKNGDLWQWVD